MDLRTIQKVSLLAMVALVFASRRSTGRARLAADGLRYPLKPLVVGSRVLFAAVYGALFAYPLWISQRSIPPWLLVLLFAGTMFALYQLPGTIVLTASAVEQRFWLRAPKRIPYPDVMATETMLGGRQVRVLGANRVRILLSSSHVAPADFVSELARRTGRPTDRERP